ncbi:MAG TPA: transporter substrate-binding domain-containing protein [candidate division Zixibacteria bacterium]|nr:transporter substrate-binding domain-containing protein [candidate division Zixibacteria bacterium]
MTASIRGSLLLVLLGAVLLGGPAAAGTELILNTQDFAPFSYEANGEVAGPAAEIIRRVCADAKITCTLRLLPWRRAQQEVRDGQAHGMFVIGWNAERAKWLHFSPALLITEYGFFVRADDPLQFRKNADVKGYTVGVYGPSNTATALQAIKDEIKDLTIDMTPDDEAAFKKLALGRVRAVYSNKDVGFDLLRKLDIKNARYAGRQQSLKYYVGFSQRTTERAVVEAFNSSFRSLHRQGVIQEILTRYGMEPAPLE